MTSPIFKVTRAKRGRTRTMPVLETIPFVPEIRNHTMPEFPIHGNVHESTNNCYTVHVGNVSLHFSYRTLIGITVREDDPYRYRIYRRENEWGTTTAKHINLLGLQYADIRTGNELQELVRGALFTDVVHAPLMKGD